MLTAQTVVDALGHTWGETTYTWAEDNQQVTATHVCSRDNMHTETETVEVTKSVFVEPTCEVKGETKYTSKAFNNTAFAVQSKTLTDIAALGHAWGETTYTWAEDNSSVTATHICTRDSNHVEEETADVTVRELSAATCETEGENRFTSDEYDNAFFAVQTKNVTVAALGHDWEVAVYTWATDHRSVTATRTCRNDGRHIQSETATATWAIIQSPTNSEAGRRKYTSAAFINKAFVTQTETVADIPALGTLNKLTLPSSLTEIEEEAFSGGAFQCVIIPNGVTKIGDRAFKDCPNLIYVYVPNSVTSIGEGAFDSNVAVDRVSN